MNYYNEIAKSNIGFEKIFDSINNQGYPPYNIVKLNPDEWLIEVALSGFKKNSIAVNIEEGVLIIENKETPENDFEYIHKGISSRDFKLSFQLGEYVEAREAKFKDGLLSISIIRELPEPLKPKTIKIT